MHGDLSGYRVFVSSTLEDLIAHRQAVGEALRGLNMTTVDVFATSATPTPNLVETSLEALREHTDIFLGIYASRYGDILPEENVSLTELLLDEATRLHLPCYIYVVEAGESWPLDYMHTDERGGRMRVFLDRLKDSNPRYFTTPQDLADKITLDLTDFTRQLQPVPPPNLRHILIGAITMLLPFLVASLVFLGQN